VRAITADDARGVPLPQLRHRSARLADVDRRARGETADRVPLRLRVPSIGVDARVASVGVDGATGQMAVPPNGATTGWYRHGASPGAPGSAVVAGHVDYAGAPGVFFRLRELGAGERVEVVYDDGSREAFTVTGAQSYTKASLPVDELFARHGGPVLALVTCGGPFDARVRHYRDNLVVRAEPSP
jgi:sortase (surface protein transpeptidase)